MQQGGVQQETRHAASAKAAGAHLPKGSGPSGRFQARHALPPPRIAHASECSTQRHPRAGRRAGRGAGPRVAGVARSHAPLYVPLICLGSFVWRQARWSLRAPALQTPLLESRRKRQVKPNPEVFAALFGRLPDRPCLRTRGRIPATVVIDLCIAPGESCPTGRRPVSPHHCAALHMSWPRTRRGQGAEAARARQCSVWEPGVQDEEMRNAVGTAIFRFNDAASWSRIASGARCWSGASTWPALLSLLLRVDRATTTLTNHEDRRVSSHHLRQRRRRQRQRQTWPRAGAERVTRRPAARLQGPGGLRGAREPWEARQRRWRRRW